MLIKSIGERENLMRSKTICNTLSGPDTYPAKTRGFKGQAASIHRLIEYRMCVRIYCVYVCTRFSPE